MPCFDNNSVINLSTSGIVKTKRILHRAEYQEDFYQLINVRLKRIGENKEENNNEEEKRKAESSTHR